MALAVCLLGCSSVGLNDESPSVSGAASGAVSAAPSDDSSAAPSGAPIGLVGYGIGGEMACQDQLAEGLLHSDVELKDRLLGNSQGPIAIEIWPLDTVVWPAGVEPARFVALRWPLEYTGVRVADGEVAVLDGAGHPVATTGRSYRLKGEWAVVAAIGGPLFGKPPWIDAFNVCRGSESVIAQ